MKANDEVYGFTRKRRTGVFRDCAGTCFDGSRSGYNSLYVYMLPISYNIEYIIPMGIEGIAGSMGSRGSRGIEGSISSKVSRRIAG